MPKLNTIPQIQNVNNGYQTFVNADGTGPKLVFTAGDNDSIIRSILLASDDSVDLEVQLIISNGAASRLLDTIKVPAGYGTDATHPAVDGLANPGLSLDGPGKKILLLAAGESLNARVVAAVTRHQDPHHQRSRRRLLISILGNRPWARQTSIPPSRFRPSS